MQFHKHRLLPGHLGGTYDTHNVVRVNVAMHAFLHDQLWKEHGRDEDRLAAQGLLGLIGKDQILAEMHRLTGPKISSAMKGKRKSPETRAKLSEAFKGKPLSPSHRANVIRALTGRPCSESKRQKLSAVHKGKRTGCIPWNKGKTGYRVPRNPNRAPWQHTEEWKAKARERMLGNQHAAGHQHTSEWRAEASARQKQRTDRPRGWKHTAEAKARISAFMKGRQHARRNKVSADDVASPLLTGSV